ncbi:MAG: DNA polymerase I [Bacilli bacterium]|nr:DNA polymerase I [Bacilli bacterium]
MEKIIMVDGNNLLFRSYYATAYNGNFMKNSKGFPTNALFGFANMINKIVSEEKPNYIVVAFDKGKTFRHEKFDFYKDGRSETPEELKVQFPIAKEMLTAMGIKYYEIDNYEADDIIGTFAKYCDIPNDDYEGLIVSSDKDLLQLISKQVEIKLLKSKDYIRYNEKSFKEEWGIDPINIIDLKALMGDSSDNIPGVKGIGEKTALKLLHEYKTLDGIYENIDNIKGATHDKLVNDKENAYMSYEIATIYKDVPLEISIPDIKYLGNTPKLSEIYEELEFYSLLKNLNVEKIEIEEEKINFKEVKNISEININEDCAIYLELDNANYHQANIIGMGLYNKNNSLYISGEILKQNPKFLTNVNLYTYDYKKVLVAFKKNNINISNVVFDTAIAAYLLEYNLKDDIAYLSNQLNFKIPFMTDIKKENLNIKEILVQKAKFIYETKDKFDNELKDKEMYSLFKDIELPLSEVLADMEYTGFNIDKEKLIDMGEEIKIKIELLSKTIYNYAGCEFNISSPIQLGEVLFEKLNLPHGKKGKTGYSTAADVLEKLRDKHPIIENILEYRLLTKLYSTYIEGLINYIYEDNKIHTIYTQTLTRTGRLSSIEPNLQNIPIRNEYGRLIRKAFIPSCDSLLVSADYSQIELRIFSCMAGIESLKEAFKNNIDVHTKTASDIFKVPIEAVTKDMRRMAKAVNFGIIYGISGFGLSENLNIDTKEATKFINEYYETYPGIKAYKEESIKQAHKDGYVKTKYNRIRTIPELENKNYMIRSGAERMALNTPIQGTAADIIKIAMVKLFNEFNKHNLKSKILVQVHDELVVDCKKEEFDIVKKLMKEVMESVVELEVPLIVDIEYGDNWYQAK